MAKASLTNQVPPTMVSCPPWQNLDDGSSVERRLRGRPVRATANVVDDPDQAAGALIAVVRDHPLYGRWLQIWAGADGTRDATEARVELIEDDAAAP